MTYSEKLKHPLWQKKRLEIMQRDNWACRKCGANEITLNVHHLKYSGGNPWETPNESLLTLCEQCHEDTHNVAPVAFYLAGKITRNCWRHDIFPGLGAVSNEEQFGDLICRNAIGGIHSYCGPYFLSCSHGCSHRHREHGVGESTCQFHDCCNSGQWAAFDHCKSNIKNCQVLFAWIDHFDCHGTLFEIGYAHAIGKRIYIAVEKTLAQRKGEIWFPRMAADREIVSDNAANGFYELLPEMVDKINQDLRPRRSSSHAQIGNSFFAKLREASR